jgi:hypothetical protein
MSTEKEIRALCMRVFVAEDSEQFNAAFTDLRIALRNSIVTAENIAMKMILDSRTPGPEPPMRLRPITQEALETAAKHVKDEAGSPRTIATGFAA